MNPLKFFRTASADDTRPAVIVFAGGMGAQIIQTAAYRLMKQSGREVYADVSYFDRPQKLAVVGHARELTHWAWQLEQFGILPTEFDALPASLNKRNAEFINDGKRMMELGLKGLSQSDIRDNFKSPVDISNILPEDVLECFLCVHVRRGDYVNVASHLVQDDEFLGMLGKLSGLVDHVVVLSDSPIEANFRSKVSADFKSSSFLDNIDAYASHQIMRKARILICSNSTFSLTAAALNPNALAIIPKHWYGGKDRDLEAPIHARCSFQIMG